MPGERFIERIQLHLYTQKALIKRLYMSLAYIRFYGSRKCIRCAYQRDILIDFDRGRSCAGTFDRSRELSASTVLEFMKILQYCIL